ncbi:methionyl-tRNA formyltransferase [soil metagenome]
MSPSARTVFLGTGGFAVPVLEALALHPVVDLVGVVTSPPRPAGRGGRSRPSPVADWLAQHDTGSTAAGVVLMTPSRLRASESVDAVRDLEPDLVVLADYGQIVPRVLLELPRHGALNLHPSLLPRHRGATPVQSTILAGDREAGTSLMVMDEGLDTGPLIAQRRVPLTGRETASGLEAGLAALSAELLREELAPWLAGERVARPQPEESATLTRSLRREDGRLDPHRPAEELARQVRAYRPWPGSFLETDIGRLVVWSAEALVPVGQPPAEPGTLLAWGDGLGLATSQGVLRLSEVQPAGGRRMSGAELRRGRQGVIGSRMADPEASKASRR